MNVSAEHAAVARDSAPPATKRIANAIIDRFEIPADHALRAATVLAANDQQWAFKIDKGYWLDPVREAIEETR
ncbi:hypothetical protein [Mycolicibacterium sp.]|uniref:hypothetical protein n=1 Tax=Mycolicibacterium sp. TaxID=2320850 RepID=UPI00356102F2